jgi:hypothetical protein
MKHWSAVSMTVLLIGFATFSCSRQTSVQNGAGWVTLFDGRNLNSWNTIGDANWRIEDGVAVADKGNGFLVSKNTCTDFQIRAEFWIDSDADSGAFIRCADPANVTSTNA